MTYQRLDELMEVLALLHRSGTARRMLCLLARSGRKYTRQLLREVGAHGRPGLAVLVRLAGLGLVRREDGEYCAGGRCVPVVWNELTELGRALAGELCRE